MATIVASFVRHLSPDDLRRYFAFRKIHATIIDWRAKDAQLKKSVIALINALPDVKRTIVFTDAEAIAELTDEAGHLAMHDATRYRDDVLQAFDEIDSGEGRALWLFINDPTAFKHAGWVRHCDQLRKGRNWDGFIAPDSGKFDLSEERSSALATACADAQGDRDGFRGAVASERFERLQSWRDEDDAGSIMQITIYTEDRPQSSMTFEDDGLTRQRLRPASELHITYCAADRWIDVVAKGGRSMRRTIAALFARHILGVDADPASMVMREIDLSVLADRSVLTRNVGVSIAEVDVKSVRFQPYDGQSHYKIFGRRAHPIHDDLDGGRLDIPGYDIDRAELTFTFMPEIGRPRGKRVTVTLTVPNGCSVKDQGQLHRPAIEEFLQRAGIYKASAEDDDEQIEAAE